MDRATQLVRLRQIEERQTLTEMKQSHEEIEGRRERLETLRDQRAETSRQLELFQDTDAELMDAAIDGSDARLAGVRPSALPTDRALPMEFDGGDPVLFKNVFPATPSGKVELYSAFLEDAHGCGLPDYSPVESAHPLTLITPSSDKRINATFGGLSDSDGMPELEMHPGDAEVRGLADGATVRVWNDLGEVQLILNITDATRPGVVFSPKGVWLRTSTTGQTTNALVPNHKADICDGACYNDTRVEIAAL